PKTPKPRWQTMEILIGLIIEYKVLRGLHFLSVRTYFLMQSCFVGMAFQTQLLLRVRERSVVIKPFRDRK
ncbi:MAG: hypothetical protein ACKO96_24220, partial [Flammeovirgaceae bacterium]